jgi:hypothetical protein
MAALMDRPGAVQASQMAPPALVRCDPGLRRRYAGSADHEAGDVPLIIDDSHPPLPEDYQTRLGELVAADRRGDAVELWFTNVLGLPGQAISGMRSGPFWVELEKVAPTLCGTEGRPAGGAGVGAQLFADVQTTLHPSPTGDRRSASPICCPALHRDSTSVQNSGVPRRSVGVSSSDQAGSSSSCSSRRLLAICPRGLG